MLTCSHAHTHPRTNVLCTQAWIFLLSSSTGLSSHNLIYHILCQEGIVNCLCQPSCFNFLFLFQYSLMFNLEPQKDALFRASRTTVVSTVTFLVVLGGSVFPVGYAVSRYVGVVCTYTCGMYSRWLSCFFFHLFFQNSKRDDSCSEICDNNKFSALQVKVHYLVVSELPKILKNAYACLNN